jgi:hypothetical protein
MKHSATQIKQALAVSGLLFWVAGLFGFFMPGQAISDNSVADEIISLNVTDRPLGEVLENLSIAANCQVIFDESWEDYPITATFDNEPLYMGLKLILRNINNAVIYGADHTIRIIIYDESEPSGKAIGHPVKIQSSHVAIQQHLPLNEATEPQTEVEFSEESGNTEYFEQRPGENAESAPDENETNSENTEAHEEESGEVASEGTAATIGPVEKESDSDDESNQMEETDSSSGGLEDSEIMENDEESNEN